MRRLKSPVALVALLSLGMTISLGLVAYGHGTMVFPISRVYQVYQANPDNPAFELAANAVAIDGTTSYYTWNEVSRNIAETVSAGLPEGFDYSPWMPDGQLASAGRIDPASSDYPRTYAGLDQVSADWPTTTVTAGETIEADFYATAPHQPSVWDVWMTTPDWDPSTPLNWAQMEFLGRPSVELDAGHFYFEVEIPSNRSGHHVLWVAWQRDDPVGEVFISTSDLWIESSIALTEFERGDCNADQTVDIADAVGSLDILFNGGTMICADACDTNDDGNHDISDAINILVQLFTGGSGFPDPTGGCGVDPTIDTLECASYGSCP